MINVVIPTTSQSSHIISRFQRLTNFFRTYHGFHLWLSHATPLAFFSSRALSALNQLFSFLPGLSPLTFTCHAFGVFLVQSMHGLLGLTAQLHGFINALLPFAGPLVGDSLKVRSLSNHCAELPNQGLRSFVLSVER